MPENDIYNSKGMYEDSVKNVESFLIPPDIRKVKTNRGKAKYYCKNKENLKYFYKLFEKFDSLDLSYVRRNRILCNFRMICYIAEKDLANLEREDIDKIITYMYKVYNSQQSKQDFIKIIKRVWRLLFPEKDDKGRIDETICPYVVRHLKNNWDKSREKARQDKLTWEEFEKLVNYFSNKLVMQAYLTLAAESLGRPQEMLYIKIKGLELCDNYAKLNISEHGKEGIGILQCIDSFPYMLKWLNQHPFKNNKDAFIFLNEKNEQLKPKTINDLIKRACYDLKINKPITCYSLKRNGVTFARLRGESDVEIQHKARWTSTKQLKTYDLSTQEDSFKMALAKRGLIKDENYKESLPKTKNCMFCGFDKIGFSEDICPKCLHIINKEKLKQNVKNELELSKFIENGSIQDLFKMVYKLQKQMEEIKKDS